MYKYLKKCKFIQILLLLILLIEIYYSRKEFHNFKKSGTFFQSIKLAFCALIVVIKILRIIPIATAKPEKRFSAYKR